MREPVAALLFDDCCLVSSRLVRSRWFWFSPGLPALAFASRFAMSDPGSRGNIAPACRCKRGRVSSHPGSRVIASWVAWKPRRRLQRARWKPARVSSHPGSRGKIGPACRCKPTRVSLQTDSRVIASRVAWKPRRWLRRARWKPARVSSHPGSRGNMGPACRCKPGSRGKIGPACHVRAWTASQVPPGRPARALEAGSAGSAPRPRFACTILVHRRPGGAFQPYSGGCISSTKVEKFALRATAQRVAPGPTTDPSDYQSVRPAPMDEAARPSRTTGSCGPLCVSRRSPNLGTPPGPGAAHKRPRFRTFACRFAWKHCTRVSLQSRVAWKHCTRVSLQTESRGNIAPACHCNLGRVSLQNRVAWKHCTRVSLQPGSRGNMGLACHCKAESRGNMGLACHCTFAPTVYRSTRVSLQSRVAWKHCTRVSLQPGSRGNMGLACHCSRTGPGAPRPPACDDTRAPIFHPNRHRDDTRAPIFHANRLCSDTRGPDLPPEPACFAPHLHPGSRGNMGLACHCTRTGAHRPCDDTRAPIFHPNRLCDDTRAPIFHPNRLCSDTRAPIFHPNRLAVTRGPRSSTRTGL